MAQVTAISELSRIFDRHLDARGLSPNTRKAYRDATEALTRYLVAQGRPTTVQSITRDDITGWVIYERNEHSPGTAASRHAGLAAFIRFCIDNDEITVSPMAGIPRPKIPEAAPPVLNPDQIEAVLRTCRGKDFAARRDTALIRLLVTTGLRRGEIIGLRWNPEHPQENDVDLVLGTLRVTRKGGREDVVAIGSREALIALEWYLKVRGQHRYATSTALWLGQTGKMGPTGLAQMLAARGREAGLPFRLHPHLLRHTFASSWMEAGGSEVGLMRAAGWRSRTMLMRYAAATADERSRNEARTLRLGDRR